MTKEQLVAVLLILWANQACNSSDSPTAPQEPALISGHWRVESWGAEAYDPVDVACPKDSGQGEPISGYSWDIQQSGPLIEGELRVWVPGISTYESPFIACTFSGEVAGASVAWNLHPAGQQEHALCWSGPPPRDCPAVGERVQFVPVEQTFEGRADDGTIQGDLVATYRVSTTAHDEFVEQYDVMRSVSMNQFSDSSG